MKPQPQLASMLKNQAFDGFLLVRAAAQRTSSNGSKYLDMTLCDISGEPGRSLFCAEPMRQICFPSCAGIVCRYDAGFHSYLEWLCT